LAGCEYAASMGHHCAHNRRRSNTPFSQELKCKDSSFLEDERERHGGAAALYKDGVLALDEISQCDVKVVGESVSMPDP
jgi:hypothetical protein